MNAVVEIGMEEHRILLTIFVAADDLDIFDFFSVEVDSLQWEFGVVVPAGDHVDRVSNEDGGWNVNRLKKSFTNIFM